jgi:electron transfer flavoprotein beta subunit
VNLIVCLKHVPDTEAKIRIGTDGRSIISDQVKFVINPYDEFAVEEAISIKEKTGEGKVTIISVGDRDALHSIRTALAMGADEGLLLEADPAALDPANTAAILAERIGRMEYDLILCGRQAIDGGGGYVGTAVAARLGLPCITDITSLELLDGAVRVKREIEGGAEVVEAKLPAVVTAQKGLNEPRYAPLKGIMKAKRMEIPVETPEVPPATTEIEKLESPPPRPEGRIIGQGADAVPELLRLLKEERQIL